MTNGNGNGCRRDLVLGEGERLSGRDAPSRKSPEQLGVYLGTLLILAFVWRSINVQNESTAEIEHSVRPPFNAEYLLYLLLPSEEREVLIGDLIEEYSEVLVRFDKRRADIWFYKQVVGSLLPLLRRQILRIGALVWLGRILRRLIS